MTIADRFSVSQYTTWHQCFEEDIDLYARLGVRGIEVCEPKLSSEPAVRREQLEMVDAAGLNITTFQPRVHALFEDSMSPGITDPKQRLEHYRHTIDLVADAYPGRELTLVTVSGKAPRCDLAYAHRTARELYPALADYAADRGLRIAFEPLSPLFMNTDTFICTLDGALHLIEDVGRPNFGLLLDVWHVWDEPLVAHRISALGDVLFGVHVCDWPIGGPRCAGDRALPGAGAIDFPTILGAIERSGYEGAFCLEIFSVDELPDSLWLGDQADIIERSLQGLEQAWDARRPPKDPVLADGAPR